MPAMPTFNAHRGQDLVLLHGSSNLGHWPASRSRRSLEAGLFSQLGGRTRESVAHKIGQIRWEALACSRTVGWRTMTLLGLAALSSTVFSLLPLD